MADLSQEEDPLAGTVRDGEVFRLVFQSSPFAILIADDEGRYVEANPEACQLFGHSRQHLVGKRVYDFVSPDDQLIQNLLDASRISAGESLPINRVPCDVSALVRDIIADQTTVHGDRFVLEVLAEVNGLCDPAALRRTLENLLGNAIKYGAADSPVRVSVWERDGQIGLAVHNRGTPIAPEEQLRIFQPYHRSQSGAGAAGWGLGLTLVRGTAEAHGGAVRVDSSAEAGTTFTVTLAKDWILAPPADRWNT
jgi:K+-sensing histidine kinase KdpD